MRLPPLAGLDEAQRAARRAPARAPGALRPSGCRASSGRAARGSRSSARRRRGSARQRSPDIGSGRSPKWIAAVLASDSTNAVKRQRRLVQVDPASTSHSIVPRGLPCRTAPPTEFTRLVDIMATLRGAGRLPVGSRADDRLAEAVRARGDLRGARGDRPPRPRRALRGAGRLRVRGRVPRAARVGGRALHDRRLVESVADKLVRRHPHVFARDAGEPALDSAGQVRTRWEEIKAQERGGADGRQRRRRC